MTEQEIQEAILNGLAEGLDSHDIAAGLVDQECAAGEYEGCSSELEMAYNSHEARVESIKRELGL